MITIEEKRLFKQNIIHEIDTWDEMSQVQFLHLFFILNAIWYEKNDRLDMVYWLYSNPESQKFLITEIKIKGKTYKGPGDMFRKLTMGRFMFADNYFYRYHNDHKHEDLDKFVASVLTRKKSFLERIFPKEVNDTETLSHLPEHTKQAILFNYGAVRRKITKQFTHVFPQKQPDQAPRKMPLPRWDKHMWKLADGASDADFKKIADSKALNILQKIDELIEESEKAKRKKK